MYHLQQPAHTLKRLVANTITLLPPKCHHISALPPFHSPEMAACYLPANGDSIGSLRRKTRFEKGFLYMIRVLPLINTSMIWKLRTKEKSNHSVISCIVLSHCISFYNDFCIYSILVLNKSVFPAETRNEKPGTEEENGVLTSQTVSRHDVN